MEQASKNGFDKFYLKSSLKGTRVALVVGTLLFILFGMVDKSTPQMIIRYLVICPSLLVTLSLTYRKFFLKYAQVIMAIAYSVVSIGLILMIKVTEVGDDVREVYSIGLTLCIIGTSAIRMRKKWVLITNALILSVFALLMNEHHDFFIHFPILFSAVIVTFLAVSSTERILRDNYSTFSLLNEERKNLKSVKDELEASDKLKSKMLSIIAHDLRGPMNSMSAMLQLLNVKQISPSEFDEHSKKIQSQIQRNQMLLENLLRWSLLKLDNKVNHVRVNIRDLTEECVELIRTPAMLKGNEVLNRVEPMVINTDPDILKMVLRNLLSNSVKYTEKGSIVCTSSFSENEFLISVNDNGTGMSKEKTEQLFNWNRRISTAGTKHEMGSGFGLLICQEFLEFLNGTMELKTALGKGTSVGIVLKA